MSHLEDRLAEFVFEELPHGEMEDARRHVAQCLECQRKVQAFRKTVHLLEELPAEDVPRRLVFVPPAARAPHPTRWAGLAWALPGSVAAVLLLAVILGGVSVNWGGGGVEIALGSRPVDPISPTVETGATARAAGIDYDRLDYARIAGALEGPSVPDFAALVEDTRAQLERIRLRVDELDRADMEDDDEIRRVRAELEGLYDMNQLVRRDFYDQNAVIQLMATLLE
jgi:anti-sigma factor RsiW